MGGWERNWKRILREQRKDEPGGLWRLQQVPLMLQELLRVLQ